jgi:hypothetical protein
MIGLLFLATVAVWLWLCVWIPHKVGNLIANPPLRRVTKLAMSLALLSSPFVDELIGKHQFEALCKANGIESADVSKARGKKVKGEYRESGLAHGSIMPIKADDIFFRDADSGEILIHYKNYYAGGGWLMRYTPLNMGSAHPMLFPGNGCGFTLQDRVFKAAQISVIN